MTDWELLQRWTSDRSEPAFRTLVERHAGFVFASALRQLNDRALAEDVTQATFVMLAQKASSFRENIILPAWLFRTVRFLATRARRTELRRHKNESEAAMSLHLENTPEADAMWDQLAPHIDDALASLRDSDRNAILLRYFQQRW